MFCIKTDKNAIAHKKIQGKCNTAILLGVCSDGFVIRS